MLEMLLSGGAQSSGLRDFVVLPVADFITGTALTTLVGLDDDSGKGVLMPLADSEPWLLLREGPGVWVIPKTPIRYAIAWPSLIAKDLRYGKQVTIAGCVWTIRLMTNIEWNRFMYGIASTGTPSGKRWASYTMDELSNKSIGRTAYIQEASGTTATVRRANANTVTWTNTYTFNPPSTDAGWRPILEYVSGTLPW